MGTCPWQSELARPLCSAPSEGRTARLWSDASLARGVELLGGSGVSHEGHRRGARRCGRPLLLAPIPALWLDGRRGAVWEVTGVPRVAEASAPPSRGRGLSAWGSTPVGQGALGRAGNVRRLGLSPACAWARASGRPGPSPAPGSPRLAPPALHLPTHPRGGPWGAVGGLCVESPKRALVGLTAPSPAVPGCGLNDNPIPCPLRRVEAQRLSP